MQSNSLYNFAQSNPAWSYEPSPPAPFPTSRPISHSTFMKSVGASPFAKTSYATMTGWIGWSRIGCSARTRWSLTEKKGHAAR